MRENSDRFAPVLVPGKFLSHTDRSSTSEKNNLELCWIYGSVPSGLLTTHNTSCCWLPGGSKHIHGLVCDQKLVVSRVFFVFFLFQDELGIQDIVQYNSWNMRLYYSIEYNISHMNTIRFTCICYNVESTLDWILIDISLYRRHVICRYIFVISAINTCVSLVYWKSLSRFPHNNGPRYYIFQVTNRV